LAAAIAARRQGFDVALADASVPPIDKACGEGIMPDGIQAARSLGIELERASGHRFRGIRFVDRGGTAASEFPEGWGLGIRRTELHSFLAGCAEKAGVRLAWGVSVNGIEENGVYVNGTLVKARWIVGADGGNSRVRRWAGLDHPRRTGRRFGFRRHFQVEPWSDHMEVHWSDGCQIYLTPVGPREICVAAISRDPHLRMEDVLLQFTELARRLPAPSTEERGGVSASRCLRWVHRGQVALVGDASGSVDAITGEGLCILFQQAAALAEALAARDLRLYEACHRRIARPARIMAAMLLLLENRGGMRGRVFRAMASHPAIFARMLALHVGRFSPIKAFGNTVALGWHMLTS
jgi:flavin-dependent dehydrogenase